MALAAVLADSEVRARFVRDGAALVEAEVARKGGLGGVALRGALKAVVAVRADVVPAALDVLVPSFAAALEGSIAEAARSGDVAAWFGAHPGPVADALLAVTDARAERAQSAVIRRTYAAMRGVARAHTMEAAPALGRLVASYLPPQVPTQSPGV